jgi:prepilin-type N-terminal cleavage/methylation domain-containing protein
MSSTRLEQLRKRLSSNNQKGFTLIELLVVISVLGVLAAIVTMSLVNVVSNAQTKSLTAEHQTVQTALDTMLADQNEPAATACPNGTSTNDMNAFPPGGTVHLYPNYIRQQLTNRAYSCNGTGTQAAGTVNP